MSIFEPKYTCRKTVFLVRQTKTKIKYTTTLISKYLNRKKSTQEKK